MAFAACKTAPPQLQQAAVPAQPFPATPSGQDVGPPPLAALLAAPELSERTQLFLIHVPNGEIVIASLASEFTRVLVPHAHAALYQPELELLWFRDGDRLAVVDLRDERAPTTTIARGLPEDENRLSISRGGQMVDANDGCDLAYVALDWSDTPKIQAILTEAPGLRLDDDGWLARELARTPRKQGMEREFGDGQIRVPQKFADCEDMDVCGTTGRFGQRGSQLVLVQEKEGGDCVQRACVLHDPKTGLFATPPKAENWGPVKSTARGPCGPYAFDHAGTSFLFGDLLCPPEASCRKLKGLALGWLVPGDSVGAPGLGNFAD